MKHFNKALTATVLSGALTLALAPSAAAQESELQVVDCICFTGGEAGGSGSAAAAGGSSAAESSNFFNTRALHVNGQTWFLNKDGQTWVTNQERINAEVTEEERATSAEFVTAHGEKIEILTQQQNGQTGSSAMVHDVITGSSTSEATTGGNNAGGTVTTSGGAQSQTFGSSSFNAAEGAEALTTAATIALPAILMAGGMIWYLNQDGQTYVTDESRVTETPTAEEREASERFIAENQHEITLVAEGNANGGGSGDTPVVEEALSRGVASETGSNSFAYGVLALAIASLIGATVFFGGRRFILK